MADRYNKYSFYEIETRYLLSQVRNILTTGSSGDNWNFLSGNITTWQLNTTTHEAVVNVNFSTTNLKAPSGILDTIQDISTTSTPTLAQLLLTNQATQTTHSVRADRTLQITTNAPLTGGGIAVDLTADRNWTLGINSANLLGTTNQINVANGSGVILGLTNVTLSLPQNIHAGATPTFNQLTLSSAGSGSSNAVRADRTLQISTNAPLTGGGVAVDLTANRSWTLGINSANLLGTTNRITVTNGTGVILGTSNVTLTLPQDIHTGASPTFAGLTINGNILQSTNAYIKNNFTSGWTGQGWQLDYGLTYSGASYLEIDNLTVRGTMRVYELLINQIRATNGAFFVTSSAKVASASYSAPYWTITIEDPEGQNLVPFAVNDVLLIQRFRLNESTVVKKIFLIVTNVSGTTITCTVSYNVAGTVEKGDVLVRIGNPFDSTRQGSIYLTSDDTKSPYIDIYDGVTGYANWATNAVRKVRLGKLTGLTDSNFGTLSGYGLYATNAYLKGGIWATFGNIAGWTFDTSSLIKTFNDGTYDYALELRSGSSKGLYLWVDTNYLDMPQMLSFGSYRNYTGGAVSGYGIRYDIGTTTLFQLGTTGNKISAFSFDTSKLTAGTATAGISLNTSATPFITGTSAKGFEVYDVNNPKLFIGKKDGSYMDYNIVADTLRVFGATVKASSFSTVSGGYDSSSGLVIGVEQGAGLGTNIINFNVYTDSTRYGYSYLYGNKEADTGSYPTDLTLNTLLSLGSYKYGNYSYSGTTFEIRGNQGVPIIQLRTVAPSSTTQQGGLYIKQDAIGGAPVKVVGARKTGWSAATGTATRTSFSTSTVTTSQLAERVKALIDDLIAHGLIGN